MDTILWGLLDSLVWIIKTIVGAFQDPDCVYRKRDFELSIGNFFRLVKSSTEKFDKTR